MSLHCLAATPLASLLALVDLPAACSLVRVRIGFFAQDLGVGGCSAPTSVTHWALLGQRATLRRGRNNQTSAEVSNRRPRRYADSRGAVGLVTDDVGVHVARTG